jgi:Tsi6
MTDLLNLLLSGQQKCQLLQAAYPSSVTLQSIGKQIDYLLELARGTSTDRSRLKDIIIGVQTAREVEALDQDAAEIFYQIASAAKTM